MQNYSVNVPTDAKRAKLMRAVDALGINLSQFIIHDHTLRAESKLVAGNNSYRMNLYKNTGSDRPQEIKLARNDMFIMTHLGLALTKEDTASSKTNYGNYPLYTFPDPGFFLGNPASGLSEWECLEVVYNGKLTIKTDNTDRLLDLSTQHLRYVPQRAFGSNVGPEYGGSMEQRGFFPTEPMIILNGQQDNQVELSVGTGDTAVIAGGIDGSAAAVDTRNVVVVQLHGFLVSNAADPQLRNAL